MTLVAFAPLAPNPPHASSIRLHYILHEMALAMDWIEHVSWYCSESDKGVAVAYIPWYKGPLAVGQKPRFLSSVHELQKYLDLVIDNSRTKSMIVDNRVDQICNVKLVGASY